MGLDLCPPPKWIDQSRFIVGVLVLAQEAWLIESGLHSRLFLNAQSRYSAAAAAAKIKTVSKVYHSFGRSKTWGTYRRRISEAQY